MVVEIESTTGADLTVDPTVLARGTYRVAELCSGKITEQSRTFNIGGDPKKVQDGVGKTACTTADKCVGEATIVYQCDLPRDKAREWTEATDKWTLEGVEQECLRKKQTILDGMYERIRVKKPNLNEQTVKKRTAALRVDLETEMREHCSKLPRLTYEDEHNQPVIIRRALDGYWHMLKSRSESISFTTTDDHQAHNDLSKYTEERKHWEDAKTAAEESSTNDSEETSQTESVNAGVTASFGPVSLGVSRESQWTKYKGKTRTAGMGTSLALTKGQAKEMMKRSSRMFEVQTTVEETVTCPHKADT